MIVAEDITSRFLNVISLFNGAIPLIAIQLRGVEVGEKFALIATRVLDVMPLGTEEEDAGEVVNSHSWEQKSSATAWQILTELHQLVRQVQTDANLNYRKHHIGLEVGGRARNFLAFNPQTSTVLTSFKIPSNPDLDAQIDEAGLTRASYDSNFGNYRLRVRQQDLSERKDDLVTLIKLARDRMLG